MEVSMLDFLSKSHKTDNNSIENSEGAGRMPRADRNRTAWQRYAQGRAEIGTNFRKSTFGLWLSEYCSNR